jgi:hypothetical protein
MLGKIRDLTGQIFSRLTVLSYVGKTKWGGSVWSVQCECGTIKSVSGRALLQGGTKSCGCLHSEQAADKGRIQGSNNRKGEGVAAKNLVIDSYKKRANRLGFVYELTVKEFDNLTSKNCTYCGSEFSNRSGRATNMNGYFYYNGIDRIDSTKGYTIDNCVTCCATCNKMKLQYGVKDFIQHITKIYKHSVEGTQ